MKRKRTDSTLISPTKLVALPTIGSNVEIQLDDGKWHSGVVIQCQTKKYLVQVDEQQLWTDGELIRTNSLLEQKRSVPFEYRPGQFLRHENEGKTSSSSRRRSDEKVSPSTNDSNETSTAETKRKRIPRLSPSSTTTEPKKSPFVWKPSTSTSTIQTRRASKNGQLAQISPDDNSARTRHSTEDKSPLPTNSVITPAAEPVPSSEVLIFRPIIRFVESTDEEEIPFKSSAVGDENALTRGIARRSSSRTSSDHLYLNGSSECQQSKSEGKSSCFLETPPPSLPDIHLTQESESPQDKQPNKSKRKQERPQRKSLAKPVVNGLLDRLLVQHDEQEESTKTSSDLADPGYLSDEYGEPVSSSKDASAASELERFYRRLLARDDDDDFSPSDSTVLNDDDRTFAVEFADYLSSNADHYHRLEQYRLEYYHDESNPRIELISNILKEFFLLGSSRSFLLRPIFQIIPNEIKTHLRLCLNNVIEENPTKKKTLARAKRLSHTPASKARPIKSKRTSIVTDLPDLHEQQQLLSPASPLTPSSASKLTEQPSTEDLLSPNQTTMPAGVIEELTVLPKERDVYEIIHCLCQCQIDNGFMIQCESCLCWSHCECVGVTATCIPAFFKCNICSKAEAERNATGVLSSLFDENEMTSLFALTSNNAEKIARILFYSRQLANLREQMIELKLRSTPDLRRLQHDWRSDDVMELAKYSPIQSDRWTRKIDERKKKREDFQTVAQTIDQIIDDVCQSARVSSCPSIDVRRTTRSEATSSTSDSMEILINHLCDDPETREVRSIIEHRYRQMTNDVDEKLDKILSEHQNIEKEMKFELGISPDDRSDDYLSYQTYESALRTVLERFKSS